MVYTENEKQEVHAQNNETVTDVLNDEPITSKPWSQAASPRTYRTGNGNRDLPRPSV
jgi:hypothetical protein